MGDGEPQPRMKAGSSVTSRDTKNDAEDSDKAVHDVTSGDVTINNVAGSDKTRTKSLALLYTNAQSLVNKINELRIIVAINNPDIVVITETWTNESILDDFLGINGYDLTERKDRNDTIMGRGGGICVYVRKCLYAWREECGTTFNQCGMIGIKRDNRDLHILAVYRSPNSTKTNDDNLCAFVEKMSGSFLIVGDFNFPDIKMGERRIGY